MAIPSTRSEWAPEFTVARRSAHRTATRGAALRAPATKRSFFEGPRPWAQLQPGEKKQTQQCEDEERIEVHRPSIGRTSPLGRKVEKPADAKPSGPSGQHDSTKHEIAHTNR
jgi:hypothetical protein